MGGPLKFEVRVGGLLKFEVRGGGGPLKYEVRGGGEIPGQKSPRFLAGGGGRMSPKFRSNIKPCLENTLQSSKLLKFSSLGPQALAYSSTHR